jgi:eukaryotic-like serine/threonine-protein kinase
MGEVYRAQDSRLNRTVAIKVLPASFSADRDRLQRFAQEARAAAALNHPNILSIFDIGEAQSAPYVVSELLEGETLRERLRNGPLPIRRVIDYSLQVARGLAAAHEKGIVHRDLKPENLFLTTDNRVKILDFGLAKLTRPEAADSGDAPTLQIATEAGMVMGTAGYMSPEQVRGKPADHRSDIFSFGTILYEMISGKRAFHGESAADTMSAILKEETPELSETARNVPPGLERIVRHCLEKHPAQRFQSAGDLAFDLEAMTDVSSAAKSGAQAAVQGAQSAGARRIIVAAAAIIAVAALLAFAWRLGRGSAAAPPPEYKQITFQTGDIGDAHYTPDGSIVYEANWEDAGPQLYLARPDDTVSRELGIKNAALLAVSKSGELAIRLNTIFMTGYERIGTLARVPLGGGTPREVLDNVQDADWSPDGATMAVARYLPQNSHWRLEYPIGHVLLDTINWISGPKISSDGKWIAFGDHENPSGDDQGSVAVVDMQGHEKKLSSGWTAAQGIVWSPTGDEVWFTSSDTGSTQSLRGVTLSGKLRTITNVPGGMTLQDIRNGMPLILVNQKRLGLRGISPGGGNHERELGWLGWSILRDVSRDGKKILFEEEADGGGPNYTIFLRDTDGSPPVRIGEGVGLAISRDGKWIITKPSKGGPLSLVPTGAGETRQLTHDNVNYTDVRYLPDDKQLLAFGIESGKGQRDYLIDVDTGNARPLTPEGVAGDSLSPDGRRAAVIGPDGKWGIWPLEGGGFHSIPGLDSKYIIAGWVPDGASLYVSESQIRSRSEPIYRVNIVTGKMEPWKTLGDSLPTGAQFDYAFFSADGSGYVYLYSQILSQAYVVKGLK